MTVSGAPEVSGLAFPHAWRRYQDLVLDAFEDDRRNGRRSTYVVAPPGSGKTLLGMEMVRRLGTRALVLASSATRGPGLARRRPAAGGNWPASPRR